jgi:putative phosphoesterase
MTRIAVISDTHGRDLGRIPAELLSDIRSADIVVHCGDYDRLPLLNQLRKVSKRFVGVFGNIDSIEIRAELPEKAVFEVDGKRFGVIHPHWGGPPYGIEDAIAKEFDGVDAILFGHTHDFCHQTIGGLTFVNPGQAYRSFRELATAAIVTVGPQGLAVEMRKFK